MRHPSSEPGRRGAVPIGFHITFRLTDDRPLVRTAAERRLLARIVLRQGEDFGLVGFGAADDHLHTELITDRSSAGTFAHGIECALRWGLRLGAPFEAARIRPLKDQGHAYATLHYALRQDSRHSLEVDPACDATSLPELLGLRVLETSLHARVQEHLPRVRRSQLEQRFPHGTFDESMAVDLEVLADAAAAALALPHLRGHDGDASSARRAAVHVAGIELRSRLVSDCLGIGMRAVQELRTQPRELEVIRAVKRQARLRSTLRAAGLSDPVNR